MKIQCKLAVVLFGFSALSVCAATHYVWQSSPGPAPPYTTWATAAATIQQAVDAAAARDEIVVTNGAYAPVTVYTPLVLRSVNGPQATVIDGGSAVGCVYLTDGATLFGFTLTNGVAGWEGGGGVYCESTNAVLSNCVLSGNSAYGGGGACGGTLNNCTLTGNIATGFASFFQWVPGDGGGALFGTLNNCTLTGNSASDTGGGVWDGTLNNCMLIGNSAEYGGGAAYSTLNNCTLTGNSAYDGGGVYGDSDSPCTLNNCIVYFNSDASPFGGNNYDPSSALNYCCTTPMPTTGVGNISADPQLASASHLSAESPCIGAGSATYASGTDIDGEPWANPPSIGCDEYHAGAVTGPLTVSLTATYTNVATGFPVSLTAFIAGRTDLSVWEFGDGDVEVNEPYTSHTWTAPGDYIVTLWAFNDSYPGGVRATVTVRVLEHPVQYVALGSTNPVAPYNSWATAATNIQDAVDVAPPGATIFVTDGTYAAVTVHTPLTLQSVNGSDVTVIDGGGAARCLYLTNNVVTVGFTLTNGSAGGGGGVYCESSAVVSNCVLSGNLAGWYGGGAYGGTLNNCTLTGNSATGARFIDWPIGGFGGGASSSTLNNCTLTGNSANDSGGGADNCTLNNCTLTDNFGDGANNCTLYNCTLTGNSYDGADNCALNNCVVSGNTGGGASGGTLNNCTLTGNSYAGADNCALNNCVVSGNTGGGASGGTLNNCTVTGNLGWGASSATLNNCIVYFNSDPNGGNYDYNSVLNYCCTTPMPTNGVGNISADPQLASASHLSAQSPCIGAGSATYASGTDIDGEAWANPPSIGCDEYHAGLVTGPLTVSLTATLTNVLRGYPVRLTAFIAGRTDLSVWDFGDGYVATNQPYASHAWTAPGDYLVTLWAFNDSYPGGVRATLTIHVEEGLHYVAASSGNPVAPYTSWATAATNIQQAVDVAPPGATIFVTNGVYAAVTVDTPLTLQSINAPNVTVINGGGTQQCVYLTNDAVMVGFTLTNGVGGASCSSTDAVLSNCVLTGNAGYRGGGAYGGTLNNCTLTGNSADWSGGGAYGCTLNNCTLTGNSTYYEGGGAYSCTLNNCIVYFNSARSGGNYDPSSTLNYCCTTPMPPTGVGNISADPQLASASHLSALSPCIGAGSATYSSGTDIDGEPWANPPSIGCVEYHAGAVTGPLNVSLAATLTNVVVGYPVGLTAFIEGRTDLSVWDFGDGDVAVNQPYTSHTWTALGDYLVTLWAFNDSYPGGVSATLTIHIEEGVYYVSATSGNPVAPYTTWATAARKIQDAVDVALPGASIFVTNGTYAVGGRITSATGDGLTNRVVVDKPLTVRSVNGPGVTVINGGGTARCLYLTDDAVMVGFTLTDGFAYDNGGGVYCESTNAVLTNCVLARNSLPYNDGGGGGGAYGGTLNNCTLTGNTALYGQGAGACDCTLNNCTLTGNSAEGTWLDEGEGGGAFYCTLNNCTLTGNSASSAGGGAARCTLNNCIVYFNSAIFGGGAYYSKLNNCTLSDNSATRGYYNGNSADGYGGGANYSTLNNCTLTSNSASDYGGGAYESTLNNCIVYFNTATNGANYYQDQYNGGVLTYSCTTPMPTNGVGNITNAPLFVDYAGGNLRLQSNSPCINSGKNAYVVGSTDLDGNPRIVGGTVDIGAYEYQAPTSIISYAWLQQYGLPTDGSADRADLDGTGMNVYQDWVAGLNPTNALSVLKMTSATKTNNPAGLVVTWESVNTRTYYLQSSTNLGAQPAFSTIQSNIVGQAGTTSYTDTTATNAGPYFYRVGVEQ